MSARLEQDQREVRARADARRRAVALEDERSALMIGYERAAAAVFLDGAGTAELPEMEAQLAAVDLELRRV